MRNTEKITKNKFSNRMLFIFFGFIYLIILHFSTFYSPSPEYVVYHIAEKYNLETDLILVESIQDGKIEITDKKIVSEILTLFNTVPSVKHNSEKFLFVFTYSRVSWEYSQEILDLDESKKTLIFNNSCKITVYHRNAYYDHIVVEYNGKISKPEAVQKGFYDDLKALIDESISNSK